SVDGPAREAHARRYPDGELHLHVAIVRTQVAAQSRFALIGPAVARRVYGANGRSVSVVDHLNPNVRGIVAITGFLADYLDFFTRSGLGPNAAVDAFDLDQLSRRQPASPMETISAIGRSRDARRREEDCQQSHRHVFTSSK